jgi:steroid delta-isomerase-like uncharacterized protein
MAAISRSPAVELVMRFYRQLWNEWDDSAVDDIIAPQIRFRGSLGQCCVGRAEWRSYRDQVRRAAPDFHNEVVDVVATDERVAVRVLFSGTHLGPLLEIPATSRSFTYEGAAFFTITDGLITDAWVIGDLDSLRRQLI